MPKLDCINVLTNVLRLFELGVGAKCKFNTERCWGYDLAKLSQNNGPQHLFQVELFAASRLGLIQGSVRVRTTIRLPSHEWHT